MNPIPTVDYGDRILYPLLFEKRLPTPTSTKNPSRHEALGMVRCTYKDWYFFHFNFTKDSYDSARLEVN